MAITKVTARIGGTGVTTPSITAFNNITGFTAANTTGTTSTNLVFSTSPTITNPTIIGEIAATNRYLTTRTAAMDSTEEAGSYLYSGTDIINSYIANKPASGLSYTYQQINTTNNEIGSQIELYATTPLYSLGSIYRTLLTGNATKMEFETYNTSRAAFKTLTLTVSDAIFTSSILSTNPSAGIGYSAGAGGAVSQATSLTTDVTSNTLSGVVTTQSGTVNASSTIRFAVYNSNMSITDTILINGRASSNANSYTYRAYFDPGGYTNFFYIAIYNTSGSNLTASHVINYNVIRGAST